MSLPASATASLPYFSIEACNSLSITDSTLISILTTFYTTNLLPIFRPRDPHNILPSSLIRFLTSIFDTTTRGIILETESQIQERIDGHSKAVLLAQAVAGLIAIVRRLSGNGEISQGVVSRELQLYSESEERRRMLEAVEGSHLFGYCLSKREVCELIVAAVEGEDRKAMLPRTTLGEDDIFARCGVEKVGGRMCQDMGLPWGFTIMAIN